MLFMIMYADVCCVVAEIPQYVPGAGYRHLEFLLGRISSLTEVSDFTTQRGNFTGTTAPNKL